MLSMSIRLRSHRAWSTWSTQKGGPCLLENRFRRSPRNRQVRPRRNFQQKEERSERQNELGDAIARAVSATRRNHSGVSALVRFELGWIINGCSRTSRSATQNLKERDSSRCP